MNSDDSECVVGNSESSWSLGEVSAIAQPLIGGWLALKPTLGLRSFLIDWRQALPLHETIGVGIINWDWHRR